MDKKTFGKQPRDLATTSGLILTKMYSIEFRYLLAAHDTLREQCASFSSASVSSESWRYLSPFISRDIQKGFNASRDRFGLHMCVLDQPGRSPTLCLVETLWPAWRIIACRAYSNKSAPSVIVIHDHAIHDQSHDPVPRPVSLKVLIKCDR